MVLTTSLSGVIGATVMGNVGLVLVTKLVSPL